MKLHKLMALGLLMTLAASPVVAGANQTQRPARTREALTPLETVRSARTFTRLLPEEAEDYVLLGLDMAEFGLTAESNFKIAKEKMALSLKSLSSAQITIKDLTLKLKATKDANEQDAIMLAILEQIVAPLDTFTDFMKVAGSDIFAKSLTLIEGIHPEVRKVMTFKDGETMGQLIIKDVDFMRNLAVLLKQLLPKLKASLQSKGVAVAPVTIIAPTVEENPFGDL